MTSPSSQIGDAIRRARERRGWTGDDLIAAMGNRIPKQAVTRWESGLGIGPNPLMDVIAALPEVGEFVILLIRQAQHRRGAQPPP
jgi:transcriptional regulator with XRE-family HTH domain